MPPGSYLFMASVRLRSTNATGTSADCFLQPANAVNSNFSNVNLAGNSDRKIVSLNWARTVTENTAMALKCENLSSGGVNADLEAYQELAEQWGPTEFVGRDEFEVKAHVLAVVGSGDDLSIVLDRSPFYAESGGQVGDTGSIATDTGLAEVLDTVYAVPGVHQHRVRLTEGEITTGQEAVATGVCGARTWASAGRTRRLRAASCVISGSLTNRVCA